MRRLRRNVTRTLLGILVYCSASILFAAQPHAQVLQTGGIVPRHFSMWSANNVLMDAGGSGPALQGLQPFELGITANPNKTGNPFPATATGNGPNGENLCLYDSPIGVAGHYLCLSANLGSNVGSIDFGSVSGGTPGTLQFIFNGAKFPFPGPGQGNVSGPTPAPAANTAVCWNGALTITGCGSGIVHVPSNTALAALCTGTAGCPALSVVASFGAIRDTFGNGNNAGASQWKTLVGTCAANSLVSDGGSCQNAADGNSFAAVQPVGGPDIRQWGADPTGVADAAPSFNACFTALGAGSTCHAENGRFAILTGVSLPQSSMVTCGQTFVGVEDINWTLLNTMPALLLTASPGFSATGQAAGIKNCLILKKGITWPPVDSTGYSGTAIVDNANSDFTLENDVIVGFDVGAYLTGARPYVNRAYFDGTGNAHAVFEAAIGGGDIGYLNDIKVQPIGTGNIGQGSVTCVGARRPGTGVRISGIYDIGNIISQNFSTAQVEIDNKVIGGTLWVDDIGPQCGFISNIGLLMKNGGAVVGTGLDLNSIQTGISWQTSNSPQARSSFTYISATFIGQDAISMSTSTFGGSAQIGLFTTNPFGHTAAFTGSITTTTLSITVLPSPQTVVPGDFITGAGVTAGTQVTVGTCTHGTLPCTLTVNKSQSVGSESMNILGNVGRFAINYLDTTGNSNLNIQSAYLTAVNAGTAPYFSSASLSNILGNQLLIGQLQTDQTASTSLYSGFSVGPDGDSMVNKLAMGLGTCTGLGTGGTCAVDAGSSMTRGSVLLTIGTAPATVGAVPLFFTIPNAGANWWCVVANGAGANVWPSNAQPPYITAGGTQVVNMSFNATIVAGQSYRFNYLCKP